MNTANKRTRPHKAQNSWAFLDPRCSLQPKDHESQILTLFHLRCDLIIWVFLFVSDYSKLQNTYSFYLFYPLKKIHSLCFLIVLA